MSLIHRFFLIISFLFYAYYLLLQRCRYHFLSPFSWSAAGLLAFAAQSPIIVRQRPPGWNLEWWQSFEVGRSVSLAAQAYDAAH